MVIRGERLTLRYPRPADAERMYELASDPEVVRHFSWGPYTSPEEPLPWIEDAERRRETTEWLEFAIADEDDRLIGITGLTDFVARDRRATIGTWLGRDYWGTGSNRESKAMLLALAFQRLGLNRVTALASPANPRSIVALERLGFVLEGVLRGWHVHRGEPRDVTILRLLRREWERGPLAGFPVVMDGNPPPAWIAPE